MSVVYASLVRKGTSNELRNMDENEFKKQWGGDGYKFERIISDSSGKAFRKETYRIVAKTDITEWRKAVNHYMEHGI